MQMLKRRSPSIDPCGTHFYFESNSIIRKSMIKTKDIAVQLGQQKLKFSVKNSFFSFFWYQNILCSFISGILEKLKWSSLFLNSWLVVLCVWSTSIFNLQRWFVSWLTISFDFHNHTLLHYCWYQYHYSSY